MTFLVPDRVLSGPVMSNVTVTGVQYVAAADNSPFGAGWTLSNVDQLVSFTADSNGPAGVLRLFGPGGWRFYQGATGLRGHFGVCRGHRAAARAELLKSMTGQQ